MAEWPNASVLKTEVPQGTVGSNPTSSVMLMKKERKSIAWLPLIRITFEATTSSSTRRAVKKSRASEQARKCHLVPFMGVPSSKCGASFL